MQFVVGIVIGVICFWFYAENNKPEPPLSLDPPHFQIVETRGSTFLLDQSTGETWRWVMDFEKGKLNTAYWSISQKFDTTASEANYIDALEEFSKEK